MACPAVSVTTRVSPCPTLINVEIFVYIKYTHGAYNCHVADLSMFDDESMSSKSFSDCKDPETRLSATFTGAAKSTHRPGILKIIIDGVSFAFMDAPKQLSFLEAAVLPFVSKLPASDVLDILEDVKRRSANVNTDEDPNGWCPYLHLLINYVGNMQRMKCYQVPLQAYRQGTTF